MKPTEKLEAHGWTVAIPATVFPDGNGVNVEPGEHLIITLDGEEYECQCRGWKLLQPYSENRYVVKTTLPTPGLEWALHDAPIENVRIVITRREAIMRGLIVMKDDSQPADPRA